jgi:hypothetical protein
MSKAMKWFLSILLVINCSFLSAQKNYWSYLVYFGGFPVNHIPKGISIPNNDKKSRMIINAIIEGSSYDNLKQKYPDSLDLKLERLISGGVIERTSNSFKFLFPVLVGVNRTKLETIIHKKIAESKITLDSMVFALKNSLGKNPDMIFHFIWSRIIDECWWNLYNSTYQTDKGPPSITFIVYPPHPYQCGTNTYFFPDNDVYSMSWSYNIFNESFKLPPKKSFFNLATNKTISNSDHDFFVKHGLINSEGQSLIYTYLKDNQLDKLCDSLKAVYIKEIKGLFDFNELSKIFQIPADDLFVLTSHEIAYELIKVLSERNITYIPILLKNNPDQNLRNLVSIRFHKPI